MPAHDRRIDQRSLGDTSAIKLAHVALAADNNRYSEEVSTRPSGVCVRDLVRAMNAAVREQHLLAQQMGERGGAMATAVVGVGIERQAPVLGVHSMPGDDVWVRRRRWERVCHDRA